MADSYPRFPNRRARTPTVIQMEAVECGAAALAIVLGYHGRIIPLEDLRVECGVSRDGSKALNIIKAARRLGMTSKGFKYDVASLVKAPLPAILFWNFNHFVVLEGFGQNGDIFYINDPASGPRKVAAKEFDESYTGVTLTFEPGPDFKKGGSKPSVLGFLLARLRGCESAFLFAILCALFLVVPGLITPAFTRIFIDDYLIGTDKIWLRPLLLGMVITAGVQIILTTLQQWCLLRFRVKLSLASSGRFLAHIMRLPMRYYAQRFSGEIGSRLALNDQVASMVGGELATIALNLILVVFFGVLLFLYDGVLAMIAVTVALLNFIMLKAVSRIRSDRNRVTMQEYGKLYGTSINGLAMIENLKSGGGEDDFFSRWAGYQARALTEKQGLLSLTQYTSLAPTLLDAVSSAAILTVGAFRIMDGELTVGTLVAFQALVLQFNGPLTSLIQFGNNLQMLEANVTRIQDVMRAEQDPIYQNKADEKPFAGIGKLAGHIELRNVTFGYSPLDPPLIEDFSLKLEPGHRIALVGGSGSGKSTVAKLLSGLYEPWSGEVLFDGHPLREIPRDVFGNSVGMVDQDIVFFSGSVRENLSLWDTTIPDADIITAARDAEIAEVITSRPGGFQSQLAEGGGNFSGGQRQRLEIARSLATNPSILILDEATSALDASTESLIDRNIRRRGCSCLIVAHRLSTIRDADEIIVMANGKIVERGNFETLTKTGQAFNKLMEA